MSFKMSGCAGKTPTARGCAIPLHFSRPRPSGSPSIARRERTRVTKRLWSPGLRKPSIPRLAPRSWRSGARRSKPGSSCCWRSFRPWSGPREAFDCSYLQIARVVGVSEAGSRQLLTRARKHLAEGRRVPVGTSELRRIRVAFLEATRNGELAGLEAVLAADIARSGSFREPLAADVPDQVRTTGSSLRRRSAARYCLEASAA